MCAGPRGRAARTGEARPFRVLKFKRGELPPRGAAPAERSRQGRVGGGRIPSPGEFQVPGAGSNPRPT